MFSCQVKTQLKLWIDYVPYGFVNLLPTSIKLFGSNKPEFGRTQYRFGAVVLILNRIGLSVGFFNNICDVMA